MKTAKRNLNNVEMSIKDHIWRLFRKAVIAVTRIIIEK